MLGTHVVFKSASDEWETPQEIFDRLDAEFNFNLDPCATAENHKCNAYYTAEDDGLKKSWGGRECFAIHHIARLASGSKRHSVKGRRITQLW